MGVAGLKLKGEGNFLKLIYNAVFIRGHLVEQL